MIADRDGEIIGQWREIVVAVKLVCVLASLGNKVEVLQKEGARLEDIGVTEIPRQWMTGSRVEVKGEFSLCRNL